MSVKAMQQQRRRLILADLTVEIASSRNLCSVRRLKQQLPLITAKLERELTIPPSRTNLFQQRVDALSIGGGNAPVRGGAGNGEINKNRIFVFGSDSGSVPLYSGSGTVPRVLLHLPFKIKAIGWDLIRRNGKRGFQFLRESENIIRKYSS
ncbi:hypothetical protein SESBI_43858 [Sesbania bispinosa]|nr:hypothetical protein SESBI_43858 [Sesbania bispinosa]